MMEVGAQISLSLLAKLSLSRGMLEWVSSPPVGWSSWGERAYQCSGVGDGVQQARAHHAWRRESRCEKCKKCCHDTNQYVAEWSMQRKCGLE